MTLYPLFNPFVWMQAALDAAAAFTPPGAPWRSELLRHHIGQLHLVRPDTCAACRNPTCEKNRADYLRGPDHD